MAGAGPAEPRQTETLNSEHDRRQSNYNIENDEFDNNKEMSGTPRKILDCSLAKSYGWKNKTNLLTGLKKEGLFAGQFEMKGLIENPEIKLNTMSFAPGILRDLFSENWLDNKNFFINRSID